MENFLKFFQNLPKFSKIFQNFSKIFQNFPKFSKNFPKFSKNFPKSSKIVVQNFSKFCKVFFQIFSKFPTKLFFANFFTLVSLNVCWKITLSTNQFCLNTKMSGLRKHKDTPQRQPTATDLMGDVVSFQRNDTVRQICLNIQIPNIECRISNIE